MTGSADFAWACSSLKFHGLAPALLSVWAYNLTCICYTAHPLHQVLKFWYKPDTYELQCKHSIKQTDSWLLLIKNLIFIVRRCWHLHWQSIIDFICFHFYTNVMIDSCSQIKIIHTLNNRDKWRWYWMHQWMSWPHSQGTHATFQ